MRNWKRKTVCPATNGTDRIHHAGLSADGTKLFVAGTDDELYYVWDIETEHTLWLEDGEQDFPEHPELRDWVDENGCIVIEQPSAKGTYTIFGLRHNYPILRDQHTGLYLELDTQHHVLRILNGTNDALVNELAYEAFSGDWAFCSFSANGHVIAVVEPYDVTIFCPEE